jgi:hypothetical protein
LIEKHRPEVYRYLLNVTKPNKKLIFCHTDFTEELLDIGQLLALLQDEQEYVGRLKLILHRVRIKRKKNPIAL